MSNDVESNERTVSDNAGRSRAAEAEAPGGGKRIVVVSIWAVVVGLLATRIVTELNMMQQHCTDAQMSIWMMFFIVSIGFWSVLGITLAALLHVAWSRRRSVSILLLLLLIWSLAISVSAYRSQVAAWALGDAADPTTSAARLHELVNFGGVQAGYQLDNRLASNPNTRAEDLRVLFHRDQLGTQMMLAANPNTPSDILERLSRHREIWVIRRLADNPNLTPELRLKLADHSDEMVRKRLVQSQRE
jgi:hypothetical protein